MADRWMGRLAAAGAALVAVLSVLYTIAYLGITPSAQRGEGSDAFFRSYLAHPAGFRIASVCLVVSGLVSGIALLAVAGRLGGRERPAVAWAAVVGTVAGVATAAHGLGDLVAVDRLAHRYATGDAATRAAATLVHAMPSPVDPRGLATFLVSGVVALVLGLALRPTHRRLGAVGVILGIDMAVLFASTAAGLHTAVLLSGAIASVVLGPLWWVGIAVLVWPSDKALLAAPAMPVWSGPAERPDRPLVNSTGNSTGSSKGRSTGNSTVNSTTDARV